MTGILLCCTALILFAGVLVVLLVAEHQICGWLYRHLGPRTWLTVQAGDPVAEHFDTAPKVIAGQDIDDSQLIAELQQAYADYRRGVDIFTGAVHEPSPEVKQ